MQYSLHTNEDERKMSRATNMSYIVVFATVVASVAIVLGAIALDNTKSLTTRIDGVTGSQTQMHASQTKAAMVSSAISIHPNCATSLQGCVDLMNMTSRMASANFSLGSYLGGAFDTASVKAALLSATGNVIASAEHTGSVTVPKWDFSDCDLTHGDTCVKSIDNKLASFTKVMLHPHAQIGGDARRNFASGFSEGADIGEKGAGFGSAMGGAVGSLVPGVGTAVGKDYTSSRMKRY